MQVRFACLHITSKDYTSLPHSKPLPGIATPARSQLSPDSRNPQGTFMGEPLPPGKLVVIRAVCWVAFSNVKKDSE